uniref:Macro domain-containing protein n=1 Tax=Pseudonaja textilis TaxID=8673 RepID=A0A670YKP4_PSETE
MNGPVSVYPYYKSLGAALYGKERLQIKVPDPFSVSIDPYHWRFLQQNYLLQEITLEMAGHCCEIKWPSEVCGNPEIMVHPSLDVSKRKRSSIKTWKEDALTVLTQILSRQKVVRREINSELWEAIRNSLVKDDILIVEETGAEGNSYGEEQQPCYKVKLGNGILVVLQKADLTQCSADVVVNASNVDLMHIGGLASRLLEAAGPELQKECKDLVRQRGSLKPGCAIITNAWKLPCKQVIHAVGPRWQSAEKEKCIKLLKQSVRESLKLADRCQHRSIAIPAISSGIFGFPLKECTRSIVTAVQRCLLNITCACVLSG